MSAPPKKNKKTAVEKTVAAANKTATKVNSAGAAIAAGFIYGQQALDILASLDQTITDLANVKFPDGKCKSIETKTEEESYQDKQIAALKGCAPYAQTFSDAYNAENPGEKLEKTTQGLFELASSVLSSTGPAGAKDKMLDCAEAQYRKFIAAIPVQYFLLIALSKAVKSIKNPKLIKQKVDTPCGEKIKYLEEYERFMPDIQLPLIPRLPYIEIPDITDLIWAIAAEQACYSLCIVTTPMIQTVSETLFSMTDAWAETDDPDYDKIPPLTKVPINSYISNEAILASKEVGLIPAGITISDVREYLTTIQEHPNIGQEEFVFLFLGNANCNILTKLLSEEYAAPPNLGYLTKGKFKLDSETKVLNFFSFLGSYVNFIRLIKDSKLEVCPPDPCDIKSADLEGIVAAVNDLCALLNPNTTLPPLPINALLKGTGTNDFIVDSTYDSNKLIAESSTSYMLPPGMSPYVGMENVPKPPKLGLVNNEAGDPEAPTTYYNEYVVKFGTLIEEIIKITKSKDTEFGILVSLEKSSLVQYKKIKDKKLIVKTILVDPNLKLDSFEDAANKYWIESDGPSLKFIDSKLNIQPLQYNDQKLKKTYRDLSYGYVKNSFPYTIIVDWSSALKISLYDSSYQKDWKLKDAEVVMSVGKSTIYTRYTKPILNKKLEQIQVMKKDKNIEDVQEDMLEFTKIKKTFFG
jgi:hypothetical protein